MIETNQSTKSLHRYAAAYTMVEILVVIAVIVLLGTILLGSIGRQGGIAEKKVIYLQNRDALVTMANDHEWNYVNPSDPSAGRRIKGLEFDGSLREHDLFYLWEIIQPHFPFREKMFELASMNFNDTYFADRWMTNLIGVDRTGYPYRTEGLEILLLENTPISDVGLRMLYQHVQQMQPKAPKIQAELASSYAMTNLLEISIFGCTNVTRNGIADLKKAIPHIKVISTFDPNP